MTYLHEVVDEEELHDLIYDGMITQKFHPECPDLAIYCYTSAAQYTGLLKKSATASACRGLIVNIRTGKVIARPFAKFYNFNELENVDLSEPYWVTDKLDGSLGIGYIDHNGNWKIATKSSFKSDQAIWANEKLKDTPQNFSCFPRGHTPLFEIIYPENRIVLDYGDEERVVLLGMVNNETGVFIPYVEHQNITVGWPEVNLPLYDEPKTFEEILELPNRPNAEGLVLVNKLTGNLIKLKQKDYIELHKIIFNFTTVAVWEALFEKTMEDFILKVPDEIYPEFKETVDSLYGQYLQVLREASVVHNKLAKESLVNGEIDPKTYAVKLLELDYEYWEVCMRMMRNQDTHKPAWKAVKPKHKFLAQVNGVKND